MRKHLLTAAAVLAAACTATPAVAADPAWYGKDVAYAITVDGHGTYEYEHRTSSGDTFNSDTAHLDFDWQGQIGDGVVFRNGSPLDTTGDDLPDGAATGSYTMTSSGGGGVTCGIALDDSPIHGWMRLLDDADLSGVTPLDGTVDLWIRPFEQFQSRFACPSEDSNPMVDLVSRWSESDGYDTSGSLKVGHNPFDIEFHLPRDIIGMGQIQQLDPAKTLEGPACPGYLPDEVPTCKLEWTAKITLTKLWEKAAPSSSGSTDTSQPPQQQPNPNPDDDLLVPLVPPKPDPDDDLLVPLVPQSKASLSRDASKASFSVSCAGGCTGSASLTAGTGASVRAARAKAVKPLARVTFAVAKGQAKRVVLKLGAKARRAVRKAGGARIVVRTVAGGTTTTKTLRLRLPRRR